MSTGTTIDRLFYMSIRSRFDMILDLLSLSKMRPIANSSGKKVRNGSDSRLGESSQ